jgi:hypothetical protein
MPANAASSCQAPARPHPATAAKGFLDIHLNPTTRWKDVPEEVWKYTLSGYQVLPKWLSYREQTLLHRPLTGEEGQQFTHHVRRIAALLQQNPELDPNYRASSGVMV